MRHVTACCKGKIKTDAAQCKDEINETLRQHTAATERRLGITGGVASRSGLTASPARQVILQIA